MIERLTGDDIANTVRMMRSLHAGAILLVEGADDAQVYGRFIDDKNCRLVPAYGKTQCLQSVAILEGCGFRGILGIVDSDFWRLEGITSPSGNVVMTDTHDLETLILASNALDRFLGQFACIEKMSALPRPIRDTLLASGAPLGCLVWIAAGHSGRPWRLNVGGLRLARFVDKTSLIVHMTDLIVDVVRDSPNPCADAEVLEAEVAGLMSGGHDPWQLCRGADLIEILAVGLREVFGEPKAGKQSATLVSKTLRLAFDYEDFRRTSLCGSIRTWEGDNAPFRVLRDFQEGVLQGVEPEKNVSCPDERGGSSAGL